MNKTPLSIAILALFAAATSLSAQIITFDFTTFDVDDATGASTVGFLASQIPSNGTVPVGTIDANLEQPGAFFFAGGTLVDTQAMTDGFRVDFTDTSLNDSSYFTFSIQAAPGYQLDLAGATVSYRMARPGNGGNADWAIATSVGGLGVSNAVHTENDAAPLNTFPAPGSFNLPNTASYDGITGPVEFRIYTGDGNGIFDVSTFEVDGTISLIPEPGIYALAFGALALLVALRRRRRA